MDFMAHVPSDGRRIPVIPFHDGQSFVMYIHQADGKLMVAKPLDMINGHYVAAAPSAPEDIADPFWEVVIRHFTFPSILPLTNNLHSDVVNALASIHRYFVLLQYANTYRDLTDTALVASELEYAFGNHRAFYDLANGVLNLFRSEPQFSAATFPSTFRKAVQRADADLAQTFGLLTPFIGFARSRERRFFLMRGIRDGIFHRGEKVVDLVFRFEDGFGVGTDSELASKLSELQLWQPESIRTNGIVSLLPLLSFIASDIWTGLSDLAVCMTTSGICPTSLIGDLHVYYRSPLARHLNQLAQYQSRQWFRPEEALTLVRRAAG